MEQNMSNGPGDKSLLTSKELLKALLSMGLIATGLARKVLDIPVEKEKRKGEKHVKDE